MRRSGFVLLAAAAASVLAACTSAAGSDPNFQPSPTGNAIEGTNGVHLQPILPVPSFGNGQGPQAGSGGSGQSPSTAKGDPLVVATRLSAPVGLAMLPDNTALVGERTTGRIVRVQPRAGQPVPTVRTLTGLDTAGGGGLLDLALSPNYDEDNLIYAYISTPRDNRVVDFTLTGPVTPVLTGIPRGAADNTGRIAFGADGRLYIGTGDAGRSILAPNAHSLAGKVLRVSDIGRPVPGNPAPTSPVFTRGHRVVDGLCAIPQTADVLEVEADSAADPGHVNVLRAGADYGWPQRTGTAPDPIATLPAAFGSPGDCAVLDGTLWVTSLNGKALLSAPLSGTTAAPHVGRFTAVLTDRYGRLKTVVAAADGALWLTTSNRDGLGKPVPADERVIRYVPKAAGGGGQIG